MNEVTNILVSSNLLFIVRDWAIFGFILFDPFLPDLLVSLNLIRELFEEESMLVGELVLRESLQVQPLLLFHPVEWFSTIINTTASFQEKADVTCSKLSVFDQDLGSHHKLEHDFMSFE